MSDFFADIWYELREKRLWPVALALVLALLAVPVLLLKGGAEGPKPAAAQPVPQDQPGKPAVGLSQDSTSSLDVFDSHDPFKPPGGRRSPSQATGDSGVTAPPSGGGSAGGLPAGGALPGADAAGSGGAGAPAPAGGGGGGGDDRPTIRRRTITAYTYVIDVTFSRNDRVRRYRGLRRLAMLPSRDEPLLVFLGVDAAADNAVFLVDSTLQARGEGECPPRGPKCSVLTLGPGSEHFFKDEQGNSYRLRVDGIRRVRVSRARGSARADGASSSRRRRGRTASDGSSAQRSFSLPDLTDLLMVGPAG